MEDNTSGQSRLSGFVVELPVWCTVVLRTSLHRAENTQLNFKNRDRIANGFESGGAKGNMRKRREKKKKK